MRVPVRSPVWPRPPALVGRRSERRILDELVEAVRSGDSRALAVFGEPGVGKSALLDYLAENAAGCRVARTTGVQSEMELPFAALQQLCAPMLDRLEGIPAPQRHALSVAFGLSTGPPPDRFLVGLAVLSLLSEVAAERPLVCLIDDHQWLDFASAQMLAFAARRLGAESLGLVFAARTPSDHLVGLPELMLGGLPNADAAALLDLVLPGQTDARIRAQIVAETGGNPLALLELTRGLTPAELAMGFELPGAVSVVGKLEQAFERRVAGLPDETRRLLLVAAADPTGDLGLLWSAAARLGLGPEAATPAVTAALAQFDIRVRFRHPLARSAVYRSAAPGDRKRTHQVLAELFDPELDLERHAWHRAQAADGPDEDIAAELDRAAQGALARGCLAGAAEYLQRAVSLTEDPAQRTQRVLVAAEGKIRAADFAAAAELLALAGDGSPTDLQQAQIDLLRAQLAYVTQRGNDAPHLLLQAATRLVPVDAALARSTYLDALSAAIFAGRLATASSGVLEVARAAAAAPRPRGDARGATDILLEGLAASYNDGYASAVPTLRQALTEFGRDMSSEEELRFLWLASVTAMRLWDDESWESLSSRHLYLARNIGALSDLPLALISRTFVLLFSGDLNAASSLTAETHALNEAIGSNLAAYGAMALAALRGDEAAAVAAIQSTLDDVRERGEGVGITLGEWAQALLNNGLGRYDRALSAARRATLYRPDVGSLIWPTVELIEAAARAGVPEDATEAFEQFSELTTASGTDWALGLRARSRALLSQGEEAEQGYREAISRLGRTRMRLDLARAHLLYGEWLRRERRRADAREQLRTAHRMHDAMGAEAFAERARRELRATGETARKRTVPSRHQELTPQEAQIARMARDGLSNPEIGTRLFISAHTVQYHLRKVYTKLGISSRSQLDRSLSQ
jgi:DNA-binding CsgD family transcriptional regulator